MRGRCGKWKDDSVSLAFCKSKAAWFSCPGRKMQLYQWFLIGLWRRRVAWAFVFLKSGLHNYLHLHYTYPTFILHLSTLILHLHYTYLHLYYTYTTLMLHLCYIDRHWCDTCSTLTGDGCTLIGHLWDTGAAAYAHFQYSDRCKARAEADTNTTLIPRLWHSWWQGTTLMVSLLWLRDTKEWQFV